tara:strand:- start:170 stop:547 length:378 start_codon:yes stop_codon:yes gene_type:complete
MTLAAPRRDAAVRYLRSTSIIAVADVVDRMMAAQGLRYGTAQAPANVASTAEVFDRPHRGVKIKLDQTTLPRWLSQQDDYNDLVEACGAATEQDLERWMLRRVRNTKRLLTTAFAHLQIRQEVAA